ncbi:hypothetical protein B0H14DRAFT_2338042, partial [Mycena olivaceomarginata]
THPKTGPFHGYKYIAQLTGRFITHLFTCPPFPPQSTHSQAKLPYFIVYTLRRTKLHQSVTYAALVLLQRLKVCFPTTRGSSGHRLFEMCNYLDCDLTVDNLIFDQQCQATPT